MAVRNALGDNKLKLFARIQSHYSLPSPVGHGEPVGNVEPSPENQIAPKKRPMSSMSPMVKEFKRCFIMICHP